MGRHSLSIFVSRFACSLPTLCCKLCACLPPRALLLTNARGSYATLTGSGFYIAEPSPVCSWLQAWVQTVGCVIMFLVEVHQVYKGSTATLCNRKPATLTNRANYVCLRLCMSRGGFCWSRLRKCTTQRSVVGCL